MVAKVFFFWLFGRRDRSCNRHRVFDHVHVRVSKEVLFFEHDKVGHGFSGARTLAGGGKTHSPSITRFRLGFYLFARGLTVCCVSTFALAHACPK